MEWGWLQEFAVNRDGERGFERFREGHQSALLFLEEDVLQGTVLRRGGLSRIGFRLPQREGLRFCKLGRSKGYGVADDHPGFVTKHFFCFHRFEYRGSQVIRCQEPLVELRIE